MHLSNLCNTKKTFLGSLSWVGPFMTEKLKLSTCLLQQLPVPQRCSFRTPPHSNNVQLSLPRYQNDRETASELLVGKHLLWQHIHTS
jgi:hypothetical protein